MNSDSTLKEFLSVRFTLGEAADSIQNAPEKSQLVPELFFLMQDKDAQIAFRSAWYLEMLVLQRPSLFTPYLKEFLTHYLSYQNLSVLRHITKILIFIQGSNSPIIWKTIYEDSLRTHKEEFVELHFSWLIDPDLPVAIRANCMDILYAFGKVESWIHQELKLSLIHIMEEPSPALFSRAKKIYKLLK